MQLQIKNIFRIHLQPITGSYEFDSLLHVIYIKWLRPYRLMVYCNLYGNISISKSDNLQVVSYLYNKALNVKTITSMSYSVIRTALFSACHPLSEKHENYFQFLEILRYISFICRQKFNIVWPLCTGDTHSSMLMANSVSSFIAQPYLEDKI